MLSRCGVAIAAFYLSSPTLLAPADSIAGDIAHVENALKKA
jgi:hypothetical protein